MRYLDVRKAGERRWEVVTRMRDSAIVAVILTDEEGEVTDLRTTGRCTDAYRADAAALALSHAVRYNRRRLLTAERMMLVDSICLTTESVDDSDAAMDFSLIPDGIKAMTPEQRYHALGIMGVHLGWNRARSAG